MSKWVNIDTKAADHFFAVLSASKSAVENGIAGSMQAIGDAAAELIFATMSQDGSFPNGDIAQFMIDRTAIDIIPGPNTVTLEIRGMTEGEAGNPSRPSGGRPKVSSPDVNLWLTHEYGVPSDGQGGADKDQGTGVKATQKVGAAGHGVGSPYVGEIRRMVEGLTSQLEGVLRAYGAIVVTNIAADILDKASEGKVKIDRGALAALNRAGVSPAVLSSIGVSSVERVSSGQINLRGSGGKFVSGSGMVPTTIKGNGRRR